MTNAGSQETELIAQLGPLWEQVYANVARMIEDHIAARGIKIPRDGLWTFPDPLVTGPVLSRWLITRPHTIEGVVLSVATPTTSELVIDLEYSMNGGATWQSAFAVVNGTPDYATIAAGKYAGGIAKNLNLSPQIGGNAGRIALTNAPAGTFFRFNLLSTGGATGLAVQIVTQPTLDLIKPTAPRSVRALNPTEYGW